MYYFVFLRRVYFEKEILLVSSLKDPNLVQTLGVCATSSGSQPWAIVSEYTALGSLRQFLEQRTLDTLTPAHGRSDGTAGAQLMTLRYCGNYYCSLFNHYGINPKGHWISLEPIGS